MSAPRPDFDAVDWRVATQCDGGACVRVGKWNEEIIIGDRPDGSYITLSTSAWRKFLLSIKQGNCDYLA